VYDGVVEVLSANKIFMMGYGYGSWGMMGGGMWLLCTITWLVVIVDLILVGVWLWQQVSKK